MRLSERRNAKVCGVFFPRRRNENDGDGYRQNNAAYVEIRWRTRKEEREHHTKITRVLRAVFRDRINDFYEPIIQLNSNGRGKFVKSDFPFLHKKFCKDRQLLCVSTAL